MTILKGKGFILRPIRLNDAEGYWEVVQDSDTKKGFTTFPKTFNETKKEIKGMLKEVKEKGSNIFTILVDKKYSGNVLLQYQNWDKETNEGRIHIWVHPAFRGRGLATKAIKTILKYGFTKRKFKKIFAQCKTSNKAVMKVIKKCGFKKVKTYINDKGVSKTLFVKERSR